MYRYPLIILIIIIFLTTCEKDYSFSYHGCNSYSLGDIIVYNNTSTPLYVKLIYGNNIEAILLIKNNNHFRFEKIYQGNVQVCYSNNLKHYNCFGGFYLKHCTIKIINIETY